MKTISRHLQSLLILMLMFSLVTSLVPFSVFAANEDITCVTESVVSDIEFPDSDEMFGYYLESLFYPESIPCLMGSAAGEKLTGDTKIIYDALIPIIQDIAKGNRQSTQVGFGRSLTYDGESFPSDKAMTFSGTAINTSALFKALLLDLPYEMYWNDKVTGCKFKNFSSAGNLIHLTIRFEVSDTFQGDSEYSVNTTKAAAAATAVERAKTIVEENKNKTDYEKLVAYRDAICKLVSYDSDAAFDGDFSTDNRPWQLVNVFDGDNTTNVVCEGYSKAFQYLCDLTDFAGDVSCYCVSGDLVSSSGSGGHMWNIVTLEGANYLVDVTNSDSGTVGYDGGLFLAGSSNGSAATKYVFNSVSFIYDEDIMNLWGTDEKSILTLCATNYVPKTTYSVSYQLSNISSDGGFHATKGIDYEATLIAEEGYALPEVIVVTVSGSEINGYIYDNTTGLLTIPAASITGDIVISASGNCTHAAYVDGYCATCGEPQPVVIPTITLKYPTLSFESEVFYNIYFTASNTADVVEMGLLTWNTRPEDSASATIDTADTVIPGYEHNADADIYMVRSLGVPAKKLGDNLYMRVYAKLSDGTYAYSSVTYYSAKFYAASIFGNSTNENMKALCVAMLNYGAAAQVHFNYNTDNLMNSVLSAEQKAMVKEYSSDMIGAVVSADANKVGTFKSNGGFSGGYPSVSFEGAFSINYYLTPKQTVDGDITLYCWDLKTYNSVDTLTEENATAKIVMTKGGTQYVGSYAGIAAKQIDETVFVAGVYTSGGVRYSSPVISYSLGAYCAEQIANGSATMQEFAKATAVYGNYAKAYFNS